MADVFISYAKAARAVTEELATYLAGEGYSVWWDGALVPGDSFRSVILRELDASKAVIVIWTQASVESAWVISEAERAASAGKLITLRTRDVPVQGIPMPFGVRHMELADNREAVLAALGTSGVSPSGRGAGTARAAPVAERFDRDANGTAHGPASWSDLGRAAVWVAAVAAALVGVVVLINNSNNSGGGDPNADARRFSGNKVFTAPAPGAGGGGWGVDAEERVGRLPAMDALPHGAGGEGPTN